MRGLQKVITEKVGGAINVVERPTIDVHGAGCSTGSLLQVTEQLVREAKILYQNIWVVFDNKRDKPSEYDPGTTVHELVEELKKYIDN